MLADAAGEDEHVEPAERRGHRGDPGPQPVHVDVEREPRLGLAGRRALDDRRACRRVPASPSSPERCSSVAASSAGRRPDVLLEPQDEARIDAARARRHHQALERREAHRRVDRAPVEDGRQRAPRAEVAGRRGAARRAAGRAARRRGARRTRATGRGSRSGAGPSARATPAAARRWRRPPAGSRGTRCRSRPRRGRPAATPLTASRAASDFGWWSGARSVSARSRATTVASISDRARELGAAVHDPVADGVDRPEAADARRRPRRHRSTRAARAGPPRRRRASASSSTRSFRLLEPALTTRISAISRPRPVRAISGASSPVLSACRRARSSRSSTISWRTWPARLAEARHAVDDVDDEVEAVEVVEHDHVERRRGRALLLVAADVDVGVVGAPVGEPVDEPRVAVVGEDHRLVGGEQRVELAVGQAVRVLASAAAAASGRRR